MRAQPVDIPRNAFAHLTSLAPITSAGSALLREALRSRRRIAARQALVDEGQPITQTLILLSGWAYRIRILRDGRRQILGFLLPGDLLGNCRQKDPVAATNVVALTDVVVCTAPALEESSGTGLAEAFALVGALDEHYLYRHVTRLGRLNALERLADWVMEIRERLVSGEGGAGNSLDVPVTQELLADALGLTAVHVNRTLQIMRRAGLLEMRNGTITLLDLDKLGGLVDYRSPIVTARDSRGASPMRQGAGRMLQPKVCR